MNSLAVTDKESAAVAVAPRVSLADIEGAIAARYDLTADKAVGPDCPHTSELRILSLCILQMRNGFIVIGKSAPASPDNFNPALGRKFAYEDAVRQLWPLMGYALRDKLAAA
jgi:Phage protein (N4 Gp49/phage Sf6 gene 66) family